MLDPLRRALKVALKAITRSMLNRSRVGEVDGITVCDTQANEPSKSIFLQSTRDALKLIRNCDPRRHARICRQFRYIVNMPLINVGECDHASKTCNVDYTKYLATKNPEWNLRIYACLLVHEATHGLLLGKGIAYTRKNWQRVEKLCRLEEFRFAQAVDPVWAAEHVRPFDPKAWKVHWGSRRGRLAANWERIREVFRSPKS